MADWDAVADRHEARAAELEARDRPLEAAAALNDAGLAALDGGSHERARRLFERVAAVFDAAGDRSRSASAHANSALVAMRTGDLNGAVDGFRRSLEVIATLDDGAGTPDRPLGVREADIRVNLGVALRRRNDLDAAGRQYARAEELYRRHERWADVVDVEANRAVLDERAGRLADARRRLQRVRELIPPGTDDHARARAATTLATVAGQEGHFDEAAALLDEARAHYVAAGRPRELADVLTNQGYVHLHLGDLGRARSLLERAEWVYGRTGMVLDRARVVGGLGSLALRLGDVVEAIGRYRVAVEVFDAHDMGREVASMLVNLGVAHERAGDRESAAQFHRAALEIYDEQGTSRDAAAQAEHNLGVALAGLGEHAAAERHYARARRTYRRAGRRREAAEVTMNLGILAAARGDLTGSRRRYRRARAELGSLGLWVQAAHCAHNLGLTWPPESPVRRRRVLPAWLVLDDHRFTLPGAAERAGWRGTVSDPAAAAFDCARHDPLLLAEVIERARATGGVDVSEPPPPPAVPGLLGPAAPPTTAADLPVRPPHPVGCGWPATLARYEQDVRTQGSADLASLLLATAGRPR